MLKIRNSSDLVIVYCVAVYVLSQRLLKRFKHYAIFLLNRTLDVSTSHRNSHIFVDGDVELQSLLENLPNLMELDLSGTNIAVPDDQFGNATSCTRTSVSFLFFNTYKFAMPLEKIY